ncbi:hypothetical protein SAMN02745248_01568 [Hathewaya proteolytica DSM 3090]|uniref:Pyridinium-3,5-bisthiocarboxylic acid mononucleotide nickel insertion protein n=1 Tax=Hathewaya proteolytica DSM 3090 TaxID=1121331 RepID=A0A1M6NZJ2_9CLOT|nr:nickel pincer cofactor biosynthesis protein LarC [Hathewaya proteolytica]SHK01074.1 hypothetical protein SAMN02745248_01568 [Hathewaya proteolytica DSM 3090]
MKTLYIECSMGAAGDMLMASLLELCPNKEEFLENINELKLPGVKVTAEQSSKCGIYGTHICVRVNGEEEISQDVHEHEHCHDGHEHTHEHCHSEHDHIHEHCCHEDHVQEHSHGHHHHSGMHDIEHIIDNLNVSQKVKDNAKSVYKLIAEAESHAHNKPVDEIHFHEVGTMDAIADVVGVCMLIDDIAPDKIIVSPVHVGSGQVKCAHGILPVPAPATSHILQGVPTYGGSVRGELCTPTGAALLKHFASEFGNMPVMKVSSIGYGMGTKDFQQANCLRTFLGETEDGRESIAELCCNIDDMTAEDIGFAMERLFEGGAMDVFTTSIGMKKNRPATMLTCMCSTEKREVMIKLMFKHTTTLGIREYICNRYTMDRSQYHVTCEYGHINVKKSIGWGVSREKAEYDDMAAIAREKDISISEVRKTVDSAIKK